MNAELDAFRASQAKAEMDGNTALVEKLGTVIKDLEKEIAEIYSDIDRYHEQNKDLDSKIEDFEEKAATRKPIKGYVYIRKTNRGVDDGGLDPNPGDEKPGEPGKGDGEAPGDVKALGTIIALHGGGGNGADFKLQVSKSLEGNLVNLVAPNGGYQIGPDSYTWLPVVDKEAGETTSNADVADKSVDAIMDVLNGIESSEITLLGYSDGAAMIIAFLGRAQQRGLDVSKIKRVAFIKGYAEGERHQGLDFSNAEFVPFNGIEAFFVAGQNDEGFYQSTLDAQAYFNEPALVVNKSGGHEFELADLPMWLSEKVDQPVFAEPLPNIPEGVHPSTILKGAIAVEGYYPLFDGDEEAANAASPEGTSHVHTFDGIPTNYYMPNGLVMEGPSKNGWHGDFPVPNWNPADDVEGEEKPELPGEGEVVEEKLPSNSLEAFRKIFEFEPKFMEYIHAAIDVHQANNPTTEYVDGIPTWWNETAPGVPYFEDRPFKNVLFNHGTFENKTEITDEMGAFEQHLVKYGYSQGTDSALAQWVDWVRFDYIPEGSTNGIIQYNLQLEMGVSNPDWSTINNGRGTLQNGWKNLIWKGSETQLVNSAWHVYKIPDVFPHLKPAPEGLTMNVPNLMALWGQMQG